ncbi:HLA class II histocompatibility antigen, DM beta chain isoform 1-T1 [Porphyrio hochstetteri]
MVGNVFPPSVEISWQLDGVPITQGVTQTHYTPTNDLSFTRFSYLPVTPAAGDIYTCIVTREGDNASVIAYWVPQNPEPSEELETVLCGAAMTLGILLGLLGFVMILAGRRGTQGAFLVQVASTCPLAANGSALGFSLTLLFNKNPLVCYTPDTQRLVPCDWGLLHPVATRLAATLSDDTAWAQRVAARRRACSDLAPRLRAPTVTRRTPPQARIVPVPLPNVPNAVLLMCHVWGFYPPKVTVIWLHNGDTVATGDTTKLLPNGDWTYQVKVTLTVTPKPGDTFTCSVEHTSLDQPLQEHWGLSLSPGLMVKVAVAAVTMTLGLVAFAAGTFSYCCPAPCEGHVWGRLPGARGQHLPAGSQRLRAGFRLHHRLQQEPSGLLRPRHPAPCPL